MPDMLDSSQAIDKKTHGDTDRRQQLLAMADLCVKCGLCLSDCPTYRLQANEADSPRGRIALVQGLANAQLDAQDPVTRSHLAGCLQCGNCNSACPSGVQVTDLFDQARALFGLHELPQWQLSLLTRPAFVRWAQQLARLVPATFARHVSGPAGQALHLPSENRVKPYLPKLPSSTSSNEPLNTTGRVGLFTGCISQVTDQAAVHDICQALETLGISLYLPPETACCGALHDHDGYTEMAGSYRSFSEQLFHGQLLDAILYIASGCGAHLLKHRAGYSAPLRDAGVYLVERLMNNSNMLARVQQRLHGTDSQVYLHSPCTLRNGTDEWPLMLEQLGQIAGDQLQELPDNNQCCGSAGLHMLTHPAEAEQLLQPKLEFLAKQGDVTLLTANSGCALHFRRAINDAGLPVKVLHPGQWLAQLII